MLICTHDVTWRQGDRCQYWEAQVVAWGPSSLSPSSASAWDLHLAKLFDVHHLVIVYVSCEPGTMHFMTPV